MSNHINSNEDEAHMMNLVNILLKGCTYDGYREVSNFDGKVTEFINSLLEGRDVRVDFENLDSLDRKPSWLDVDKIKVGQKFASDFYLSIACAELVSLIIALCNDLVLRKLMFTGKSSEPYTAFKRYLSTGERVKSWFTQDLFDENSIASKNISRVNSMHKALCGNLNKISKEDFYRATESVNNGLSVNNGILVNNRTSSICPFLLQDLSEKQSFNPLAFNKYNIPINQTELLGTLASFVSFVILYPEKFGIDSVKYAYELECFVHLWRYIAYRLGTQDKYNLCSGSYREARLKSKLFVDLVFKNILINASSKWEHMTRSVVDGIRYYSEGFSYEVHLMFALHLLEIDHKHLSKNLPIVVKLGLELKKFLFYYIIPITWIRRILTKMLFIKIDKTLKNMPTKKEFYDKIKHFNDGDFHTWRSERLNTYGS